MHRAKRIANDFNFEVKRTTNKFLLAGFPRNFIRNTIEYFSILLTRAPEYTRKKKILEAFLIKSINPFLNEQLDTELFVLFRIAVT